jgi:hypothetical protein
MAVELFKPNFIKGCKVGMEGERKGKTQKRPKEDVNAKRRMSTIHLSIFGVCECE